MIKLEKNKKSLTLINNSSPVINFTGASPDFQKLMMSFQTWYHSFDLNIDSLSSTVAGFSKLMGSDSLGVKVLGSENRKNHIWILSVDGRKYIFFISLRGLSIEVVNGGNADQIVSDLKKIQKKFKFKPFAFKR